MRAGRGHTSSKWVLVIVVMAARAATAALASSCGEESGDDDALASDAGLTGNDSGPIVIRRDGGQQANDVDAALAGQQPTDGGAVEAHVDAHEDDAGLQRGDASADAAERDGERDATAQDSAASAPEVEAGARDAALADATPDLRPDASDAHPPADGGSNSDARGPLDGAAARAEGDPPDPDQRANDAAQVRDAAPDDDDALDDGGPGFEPPADPPTN